MRIHSLVVAACIGLFTLGTAHAQALACAVPSAIGTPQPVGPSQSEPVQKVPVGGYTLSLSWSPQFCRTATGADLDFQCHSAARFGFVLHGLWPDGRGDGPPPQFCRPAKLLPSKVLRANMCMSPSVDLLQHEWAKHGTCMSRRPQAYFKAGRRLFGALAFPDMASLVQKGDLTQRDLRDAFLAANRQLHGLTSAAVRIRTSRDNWLEEIYVCLDAKMRPGACRRREPTEQELARPLRIWPAR
ncbi:MAG: ribonuclease T [Steroidobacteraceae bacterium]